MPSRRRRRLRRLARPCSQGLYSQEAVQTGDLGAWRDTLRLAEGPTFQLRPGIVPGSLRLVPRRADSLVVLDARTGRLTLRPPARLAAEVQASDAQVPDTLAADTLAQDTLAADTLARDSLAVDRLAQDGAGIVVAIYRTLPFAFDSVYARRRVQNVAEADTAGRLQVIEVPREEDRERAGLLADSKLQRSGSITRGIIAGNARDVSVESGLRLQLSGEITEGVRVQAVLTDENTPIQPEGTTQRLSEIDRVYIQLDAKQGQARLGDVDLRFQESRFARFQRKLQGVAITGNVPGLGGFFTGGVVTAAGATTRGLFQSQDLNLIDGVQGPYRLVGANGERFIIVIAGSERVYLDGVLLERGESQDYTIDYATGEITFTPNRLISEQNRLTVDFEYSLTEFTRTLLGGDVQLGFWPGRTGAPRLAHRRDRAARGRCRHLPRRVWPGRGGGRGHRGGGRRTGRGGRSRAGRVRRAQPVCPVHARRHDACRADVLHLRARRRPDARRAKSSGCASRRSCRARGRTTASGGRQTACSTNLSGRGEATTSPGASFPNPSASKSSTRGPSWICCRA